MQLRRKIIYSYFVLAAPGVSAHEMVELSPVESALGLKILKALPHPAAKV